MAEVTVYSSRYCGYCRDKKKFLRDKGVTFKEILVDANPELRMEVIRKSQRRTVPQIWIGDTHIGGFTDMQEMERSGKLDKLLQGGA